ncbi:hypothetical protein TSH58p_03655 [Azospirillum sp. TSH58]|uniref:response regulator n=1 Tax=Azospirillum sp. TSH58 TaxID=664962 RepID=UPI000D6022A0|nr:response regulator [Azospirillum sp. TSH58]AWJ82692.1 hypothetical protein TSH58p_03655 [Azospirillum sp. TSH58]
MTVTLTIQDYSILVIEPHTQVCDALRIILNSWGFRVLAVNSIRSAECQMLSNNFTPNLIIVDLPLPYIENELSFIDDVSKFLTQSDLVVPVIAMTGNSDDHCRTAVEQMGWTYLLKPFPASAIFSALTAISYWRVH